MLLLKHIEGLTLKVFQQKMFRCIPLVPHAFSMSQIWVFQRQVVLLAIKVWLYFSEQQAEYQSITCNGVWLLESYPYNLII